LKRLRMHAQLQLQLRNWNSKLLASA